ncbi:ABC transporter substrate-binding protein [Cyclonatronum proteinivorum]|nr:ABC transporter substrate-binding protein [Cyclonatronum proteinivorum]
MGLQLPLAAQTYLPESEERFSEGMNHYRALNFERAAEAFREAGDMPEARLMLGNSLFQLNRLAEATDVLESVRSQSFGELSEEATYSLALVKLTERAYGPALELLTTLNHTFDPALAEQASGTAQQWARFLTLRQRLQALDETTDNATRIFLLETGIDVHPRDEARQLITKAMQLGLGRQETNALRSRLDNRIARNISGRTVRNGLTEYEVPEGFVYRIAVVLPQQDRAHDAFGVSRAMFNGLQLAVNEYNRTQSDTRIDLRLYDNTPPEDAPEDEPRLDAFYRTIAAQAEAWQPDMIFGPLFSDEAAVLARIGQAYEIPVMAPLANSEDLTPQNPWIFQMNPTFRERGRLMAEIAVQHLGHRKISILVDANSIGVTEAEAFRQRARELGAEIPYFIREDFQNQRFDMSPYSKLFTSDPMLLNLEEEELEDFLLTWTQSDALFMPVTGSAGRTVFELMMTQLMALRSNVQVIGSQEVGGMNLNQQAARRFRLVYSEVFDKDPEHPLADVFSMDFRNAFGSSPDMFATIGYDSGTFITQLLANSGNPEQLKTTVRQHEGYRGIGKRFDFLNSQINNALIPLQFERSGFTRMQLAPEPLFDPTELTEAAQQISTLLAELTETDSPDSILQAYYSHVRQGVQPEDERKAELFRLLQHFEPAEIPFMIRGYRIEDFE